MKFTAKPYSVKITDADTQEIEEASYHYHLANFKIINRIYYIYKTIGKAFKLSVKNWKLDEYDLECFDIGDLSHGFSFEYQNPFPDFKENRHFALIKDESGREIEFCFTSGDFPTRWIFEDFEEEFVRGVKKYNDKLNNLLEEEKARREKTMRDKNNRKKIIARVKKKLTTEELEVVFGRNF